MSIIFHFSFAFICMVFSDSLFAQKKEFEGLLEYEVKVHSKLEMVSEQALKAMLATDEHLSVYVKQGNYLHITGPATQYYVPKDEKVYIRFRKIDTLYYMDYNSDSSELIGIKRLSETKNIAGRTCKCVIVNTDESETKYCYDSSLYNNPEYDKHNRIGRIDVFVKETNSIWLSSSSGTSLFSLSYECQKVESKKISDSVFILPDLPVKKFEFAAMYKEPEFTSNKSWDKYLSSNLNADLGKKYIKIPKGESVAKQTILVQFMINEYGKVVNPKVANKEDVHYKLAEEAIRVIQNSPDWRPATIFGENTFYTLEQPVTFSVSK